jgi:hypothetical protein
MVGNLRVKVGSPTEAHARYTMSEGWCGSGDLNPDGITTASPSSWCVCQFRHFRVRGPNENVPAKYLQPSIWQTPEADKRQTIATVG